MRINPHPYTLDFNIYYQKDRNEYVKKIIAACDTELSQKELEQLGDYIIYGKDETNLSQVDTRDVMVPTKKYSSFKRKSDQNLSLDSIMDDPITAANLERNQMNQKQRPRYTRPHQTIIRPKYDEDGNEIDPGSSVDSEGNPIPYIRELWASIDRWRRRLDMWNGKIPPDDWALAHWPSTTKLYTFRHFVIELQRQQFIIKDTYNPAIVFQNLTSPAYTDQEFDEPAGYWLSPEEWCARKRNPRPYDLPQPPIQDAPTNTAGQIFWKTNNNVFDFENPAHVLALIDNYAELLLHNYEELGSNGRTLCMDLERYVEMADLDDVEQYLLESRVAHRNAFIMVKQLAAEGIDMSESRIRTITRRVIPSKIATIAKRERLLSQQQRGEIPTQTCYKCRQTLPLHTLFFTRDQATKTGFATSCKQCGRKKK